MTEQELWDLTQGFESENGIWIIDPFLSECGRFEVKDIKKEWNLSDKQVKAYMILKKEGF